MRTALPSPNLSCANMKSKFIWGYVGEADRKNGTAYILNVLDTDALTYINVLHEHGLEG